MSTTQPPKPKRRWYQFSLKTLLVVMTVATVAFGGWVQFRRQRARENRDRVAASEKAIEKAVAAIENSGGMVFSGNEERRPQTWLEELFDDPGDADDPVRVLKVTTVIFQFYAQGGKVTDAELKQLLKGLENLEDLDLYRTNITDAGLEHVKGLKHLRYLNLHWQKKVTDAGLEHLKGLESLQHLDLRGTKVTDGGVENLQRALPNCKIDR